jgi:polar amino acid transport system substrate-binding protein
MNEAILKEGGFSGESRVVPTKRLTRQMQAKITDCSLFHRTPWSETNLLPVAAIGQTLHTLIIAKKEVNISRYEDLKEIPIATLRGSHYGHRFDHDDQLEKLYTEGYLQSIRLLKAGRVGAVIGTDLSLYFVIKKVGIALNDLADPLVLTSRPIWLHCSRQLTDTLPIDRIRQAVVDLRERGFFQNIVDQYLKEIALHSNIR